MKYKDDTKTQQELSMDRGQNPYAEGSRYYDLWESNPYTMDKMTQKQTGWDKLANFFGFRSAYDTAVDQRMQAAREYDAQIAQLQGEDKYNSPQEQAARMRAAGENPDLLGVEGGGTAAEFSMEQTTPEITPDENLTRIGQVMNGVVQAITLASGMTDSVLGAIGTVTSINSQKLDNIGKMENLAQGFWDTWIPDFMTDPETGKEVKEEDYLQALKTHAKLWAKGNHLNKQQTQKFIEGVIRRFDSDKEGFFNKKTANEEARRKWGLSSGSKYFTGDRDFEGIRKALEPLTKLYDTYIEESSSYKAEKAKDDASYQKTFDATTAAEAANKENNRAKQQSQLEEDERRAKAQVMHKLTEEAKKGNKWAFFLSLALPIAWNKIEGAKISGSSGTDAKGNETSSSNWAF